MTGYITEIKRFKRPPTLKGYSFSSSEGSNIDLSLNSSQNKGCRQTGIADNYMLDSCYPWPKGWHLE